jgi:tetratricopeptide (TPR) repeat protein
MKTKLICIFLFSSLLAYSQRILSYQEDVSKADIYMDGDEDSMNGMVEIECSASIPLTFRSETLGRLKPDTVINNGETINYRIILNRNPRYFGQDELHIMNPGYRQLTILLKNVKRKELKYFQVYDPNMERELSCYLSTKQKADLSFEKALYQQAKDEYKLATECEDYKKDSYVEKRIQDIDSIEVYVKNAEAAYNISDFWRASEFYQKAFNLNQNDKVLEEKRENTVTYFLAYCSDCFDNAERYFKEKNFERAQGFYEEIVKQDCYQFDIANARLRRIAQQQRYHSLNYEFASNTPIGFSTGNYKEFYKMGMYFSFRLNPKMFRLISDIEQVEKAEINTSFGGTIMLYKPVWLFFGPGLTAVSGYDLNEYTRYSGEYDIDDSGEWYRVEEQYTSRDFNIKVAVSSEIGLLGKIPIAGKDRITVRYTLQFRFALKTVDKEDIGSSKHVFGIGLCF